MPIAAKYLLEELFALHNQARRRVTLAAVLGLVHVFVFYPWLRWVAEHRILESIDSSKDSTSVMSAIITLQGAADVTALALMVTIVVLVRHDLEFRTWAKSPSALRSMLGFIYSFIGAVAILIVFSNYLDSLRAPQSDQATMWTDMLMIQAPQKLILSPLLEELVWRGSCYVVFRRVCGPVVSATIVSCLFCVAHFRSSDNDVIFIMALWLTWCVSLYGIIVSILVHACVNGLFFMVDLGSQSPAHVSWLSEMLGGRGYGAYVVVVLGVLSGLLMLREPSGGNRPTSTSLGS